MCLHLKHRNKENNILHATIFSSCLEIKIGAKLKHVIVKIIYLKKRLEEKGDNAEAGGDKGRGSWSGREQGEGRQERGTEDDV